jgi:hypothetical protein
LIVLIVAALGAVALAGVELALPGNAVYHAGWYNVLLAALAIVTLPAARRCARGAPTARRKIAALVVAGGAALAGFAGIASGLLAPDNQTYVGAPGQRIRVESLGALVFPLASPSTATDAVTLERPLHGAVSVGERARYAGNFVLRTQPRNVVYVEARDLRGDRLTVTQPSGTAFLSPVLMMQHRQTIAGLDLPYDSFNVPAARRIVKAVMFTPAQAAMFLHGTGIGTPAVLFAVDDDRERPLPHAIALSAAGEEVRVGGLRLRAIVASYPAAEVVAAPNLPATALGALLVLGGLVALIGA